MKVEGPSLENGISPRLQLFIHQKNVDEVPYLEDLHDKAGFARRVKDIGRALMSIRVLAIGRMKSLYDIFGHKEDSLCQKLASNAPAENLVAEIPVFLTFSI